MDIESTSASCSQVETYSGEVCRNTLTALQACYSNEKSALSIPTSIDQEDTEDLANLLVNGLQFFFASQECIEAAEPFICLTLFPLCDSDNIMRTVSRDDCVSLRDICGSAFRQAELLLGPSSLPNCEKLPDIIDECNGKYT